MGVCVRRAIYACTSTSPSEDVKDKWLGLNASLTYICKTSPHGQSAGGGSLVDFLPIAAACSIGVGVRGVIVRHAVSPKRYIETRRTQPPRTPDSVDMATFLFYARLDTSSYYYDSANL